MKKNCSYCNKPFSEKLWYKECDFHCKMEGWTSGYPDVDKFIKDTIYNARNNSFDKFLEWVSFDKFTDIKSEFAKVYSAVWIDGKLKYWKNRRDGSWEKSDPKPKKVTLKSLNGSQNILSDGYLDEVQYICVLLCTMFI